MALCDYSIFSALLIILRLIINFCLSIQKNQILFPRKGLMLGLISLPYEVLSNIAENISFDDVFNLGRTCKAFQFLLTEESICKSFVQVSHLRPRSHVSKIQSDSKFPAADIKL